MADFTIDPTSLLPAPPLTSILNQLLEDYASPLIPKGVYRLEFDNKLVSIELTHTLLRRKRQSNQEQQRIEVLKPKEFIEDTSANSDEKNNKSKIYESLGVLMPEHDFAFKEKPADKTRLCKIIPYFSAAEKNQILAEAIFDQYNELLHAKDAVFTGDKGCIVLRKAQKCDLFFILDQIDIGELSLNALQRLKLTLAILKAVKQQVIDKGLIHNDLKPENVIVDLDTMTVTITDYAYAIPMSDAGKKTNFGGTWEFIPPEALMHDIRTPVSDAFSTGLIAAQVWNDQSSLPKKDQNREKVIQAHRNRKWEKLFEGIEMNDEFKHEVQEVLEAMTAFDETKRLSVQNAIPVWEKLIEKYEAEANMIALYLSAPY